MAIGDVFSAQDCDDVYYVDTGMYDVPEYGSVYILDADRPALIDTGLGTNYRTILDAVTEIGVAPEELAVIALTHIHLDHAGGAGQLIDHCPNATVYVHEIGAPHLVDPTRLWEGTKSAVGEQIRYYTEPQPIPDHRIETIEDGDTIDLGDHTLTSVHAPGHAPHQVVFYDPTIQGVFTADAAGIYTPSTGDVHVTSPPPNFDFDTAVADVERIQELDPDTLLYGHFGPAPAADRLETYAETLTSWVTSVREQRTAHDTDEAVIDHFVTTVETPDIWSDHKARAEVAMNVRGVLEMLDRDAE
jgi:glyoxylase-like metal-dependent hydrolase (beta-lactamase superfamily II)